MKLKDGFLLQNVGGEHMAVASGKAAKVFNGLIRNNGTADFIYHQLMQDTTEEQIVDAMVEKYDAPREVIAKDVHNIIAELRKNGFLDE